jgi:DNA replication and repair protein RecF
LRVTNVSLADFRCYEAVTLELPAGITVVRGDNGQGKTSLLEAVAWAARGRSFRGVRDATLVRDGAEQAIIRIEIEDRASRRHRVEAELRALGRNRVLLDGNPLTRTRDLLGALRVSVFAPDDLELVKGGPSNRRTYLDDLLVDVGPRYAAARADYDRVLRHRNALLKAGIRGQDSRATLDVFDEQLVRAGAELVRGRLRLGVRLGPGVSAAYRDLAGDQTSVATRYSAEWADGSTPDPDTVPDAMRTALEVHHRRELERGVTLVGPHRDEWQLSVDGLDARTHASQGEQRTLALALRLAGHRVVAEVTGDDPVLLLDDVFSELDDRRAAALVERLPATQTLLTTAGSLPRGVEPVSQLRVTAGRLEPE